jgi:hypothetical protein
MITKPLVYQCNARRHVHHELTNDITSEVTTMIGLLTSLSRQLVNTARSLCERHVGAAVVASQIRRIASKLDKNQNAWQEIIERAAESSPSGSGQSPVSANNSPTSIRVINAGHVRSSSLPSSPLAPATNSNTKSHTASPLSLDPLSDGVDGASISSDDTTTSSPIHPGNEGSSSQQQLLIEIIHHIDKLFELSNRVESVSHQLEGQIATFGVDEVASTDLYVSVRLSRFLDSAQTIDLFIHSYQPYRNSPFTMCL